MPPTSDEDAESDSEESKVLREEEGYYVLPNHDYDSSSDDEEEFSHKRMTASAKEGSTDDVLVFKIDKGPISNGDGWDCSSDKYRVNAKSFYIKTKGENAGQIVSMPLPGYFGRIAVTAPQAFDIAAGVWTQWVDVKATCQDVTDDEYLNYLRRHLPVNSALVLAMNDDDFNDAMVQFYILQDAKEASSEWGTRGRNPGPYSQ